jgi:hypothetical protein
LLSLFAAQAGAKHVYGVEASKGIYELSKRIISVNGFSERITLINAEIEKVALPTEKVDIIVSEWMGFYLLHESMLSSVIYARDKWLDKKAGLMYPSVAYLYMCPVEMDDYLEQNLKHWSNFNELNFEPFASVYRQLLLEKPLIECVKPQQLLDEERLVGSFDLLTVTNDDIKSVQAYDVEFSVTTKQTATRIHGFAFWFDVLFKTDNGTVTLSSSPKSEPTHWKQTIAFLPESLDDEYLLKKNDEFECFVIMNQLDENPRHYQIDIGVDLKTNGKCLEKAEDEEEEDEEEEEEAHPMPCDCGHIKCVLIKAAMQKYENQEI